MWVSICLNADQKRQRCQSEKIWIFFRRDPNGFLLRFVKMNEIWLYHIDPEQNNNQCSGGIAVHPTPKNSECKNTWKKSRLDFLGSRQHHPR